MERRLHNAHRGFYVVQASRYFAEVREGGENTDGSVPAHPQIPYIVEEDDRGGRTGLDRFE